MTTESDHLMLEDMDKSEVFVNSHLYDNDNIEVRYSQALDPWRWTKGYLHALGESMFLQGIIAIFILLYLQDLRIDRNRLRTAIANSRAKTGVHTEPYVHRSFLDRMSTHLRAFTYRRKHWWLWRKGLGGISLGLALIIAAGWAYPMLYVFTQHPYYRMFAWYGPPGIAGRSGMIAVAITPFSIALGMKANWVSLVTGVGHERLNVLHRWLGLLCGVMAVIHTVPFLYEPVRDGGWGALREKLLHGKGNIYYWNGFAALACLLWLDVASLPFLRRWRYEFFVHLHIICGVGYLAMLFWHCADMLTSWHYLWTTVVVWASGLVWRFGWKTNWFSEGRFMKGEMGTVSRLVDDGVKITIQTKMKWRPGQHIFLRIPEVSYLDNHPFTIASVMKDDGDDLPSPSSGTTADTTAHLKSSAAAVATTATTPTDTHSTEDGVNEMVLVFKPYKGFTKKMFDISRRLNDVSYRVLLDGPYGGMPRMLESFDTVLLIAGGSGITPVVAHLQDLCRKIKKGRAVTQDVRIVWTVKRFGMLYLSIHLSIRLSVSPYIYLIIQLPLVC